MTPFVMKPTRPLVAAAFLALMAALPATSADKLTVRGMTKADFPGWGESLQMESREASAKAVLVPGIGGRVVFYGLRGENLLWTGGAPTGGAAGGAEPFTPGGFAVMLGPEVAALKPQPGLSQGPWEWTSRKKAAVLLRAPEVKGADATIEKEVAFDTSTGEVGFVHRLKNTSDRDGAFCLWSRIACRPGGFVVVPLNKRSRFVAGWSMRYEKNGKLAYDGANPKVEGVEIHDGVLVAKTGSGAAKVGVDSDAQWLAYVSGRLLFIVNFPYYSTAVYSEGGNSVTFSWDERFTELQPMGPEARLRSGKHADLPMKWALVELPAEVKTHAEARAIVDKVPPSPFL